MRLLLIKDSYKLNIGFTDVNQVKTLFFCTFTDGSTLKGISKRTYHCLRNLPHKLKIKIDTGLYPTYEFLILN